jgi:hypothetical protein
MSRAKVKFKFRDGSTRVVDVDLDDLARKSYIALKVGAMPIVERASRKGPRRGRMPKLDQWLDEKLVANARASNSALWKALPTRGDLYRKDGLVIENGRGLGLDGFNQRVTDARKRAKQIRR